MFYFDMNGQQQVSQDPRWDPAVIWLITGYLSLIYVKGLGLYLYDHFISYRKLKQAVSQGENTAGLWVSFFSLSRMGNTLFCLPLRTGSGGEITLCVVLCLLQRAFLCHYLEWFCQIHKNKTITVAVIMFPGNLFPWTTIISLCGTLQKHYKGHLAGWWL